MKYRINQRTGSRISEIGIGTAYLCDAGMKEGTKALQTALEGGINYFDLGSANSNIFPMFGEALSSVRSQYMVQMHFGADYTKGEYGWTLDLDRVKRSIDLQMKGMRTDYIDFGFIHCQDEMKDWKTYKKNGILRYIEELRDSGTVRAIGLSSHTPEVIMAILEEIDIDMLMFSINPAYDYQQGEYANGSVDERSSVYRLCQSRGIGISVMKPFSGGQLFNERTSPFGFAMTRNQCLQYVLDRPGVLVALPGVRNTNDVQELLAFEDSSPQDRDYSRIGTVAPGDASGKCVYCNHCQPCPAGIDVGLVNKLYDLAKIGDSMAAEHYRSLTKNAEDCISCGHCDRRCPFHVKQSQNMSEIAAFFAGNH